MSTPSFRAPVPGDTDALVRFFAEVEQHDGGEDHLGSDDIEEYFANPMVRAGDDWFVVELDSRIVGTSYLWPRAPADGEVDLTLIGMVHPRSRGQGIGTAMLTRMLARVPEHVEELAVRHGTALRPVVRGFTIAGNEPAHDLLQDHGFTHVRWSSLMQADLGPTQPGAALPPGYASSTWEGVDADELRAAHNLAYGDSHAGFTPWDAQMWTQFVTGAHAYRPALSLLARTDEGEVAGYVQVAQHSGVAAATGMDEAFVAKIGTTPDHRGRGLAAALLSNALSRASAAGLRRATLEVELEGTESVDLLGLFERAGFHTVTRYRHYERGDQSASMPSGSALSG